jgi:aminodeoxyfutalosine synthase
MKTNCTMLYGHIESYSDRVLHMQKLRDLQDETNGFNCFIPLKYKTYGNRLGITTEISLQEELKNYAISRLFLDNIPHLKAYWPMCGKETAILALSFGADDFDGTISNTTKIYSMAGSEQNPGLSESEITELLNDAGFEVVERDSEYHNLI